MKIVRFLIPFDEEDLINVFEHGQHDKNQPLNLMWTKYVIRLVRFRIDVMFFAYFSKSNIFSNYPIDNLCVAVNSLSYNISIAVSKNHLAHFLQIFLNPSHIILVWLSF